MFLSNRLLSLDEFIELVIPGLCLFFLFSDSNKQAELIFCRETCQSVLSLQLCHIYFLLLPIDAQLLLFRTDRALALLTNALSLSKTLLIDFFVSRQFLLSVSNHISELDGSLMSLDRFKLAFEYFLLL